MANFSLLLRRLCCLLAALLLASAAAYAQAPAWSLATIGNANPLAGNTTTLAVATDASGNVFMTGYFTGTVAFGTSTLVSAGANDLFVAKYVPATNTWAWAASGGGTGNDQGTGIAVSGTSVYLTGSIFNTSTDANGVALGGSSPSTTPVPVRGASLSASTDLLVAKYTDSGSSAAVVWAQVGGGTGTDQGQGVAVSGPSVYVTGTIFNSTTNANGVLLGGNGTTAGTVQVNGANPTASLDLVVAKYTDNGPAATLGWTQVGGGTGIDQGQGVAVSGPSVYVTGSIANTLSNTAQVQFGGTGTTPGSYPVNGASPVAASDLVLAKYLDAGATASVAWVQVGGGSATDYGYGVAVAGTSVYVVGSIASNQANTQQVVFSGAGGATNVAPQAGASSSPSQDLVLAKYTDNGATASLGWTQVGGGGLDDYGYGLVVSGTSVYVTGILTNNTTNAARVLFGGAGLAVGTLAVPGISSAVAYDLLVAKYTDQGPTATVAWTQVGGSTGLDAGYGIGLSGPSVYAGGYVGQYAPAIFGTAQGSPVVASTGSKAVLGQLSAAAGTWQTVATANNGGTSVMRATATDASGNVFVTGSFLGQLTLGSTTLFSQGDNDLFIAKYVPATNTWAWAASGGGTGTDASYAIAVSGTSVYLTGSFTNDNADTNGVRLGGSGATAGTVPVKGIAAGLTDDLLVAKYTDQGSSAILAWVQVGGGNAGDSGQGLAVSGTSVYVTGAIYNNRSNSLGVLFGGNGTTAGTVPVAGASANLSVDWLVVKYTDQGTTAAVAWMQVGGGTGEDYGGSIAVRGTSVYATGYITNTLTNSRDVLFGGNGTAAGTVAVAGASTAFSSDLLLVKYLDQGTTAAVAWTQVGGGTNPDYGYSVAVSGPNVYVAGIINNSTADDRAVVFGGSGLVPGSVSVRGANATPSFDCLLVKYVDNGPSATLGWTQVGGGSATDYGYGVAVNGANVFVTGLISNNQANANAVVFGGNGSVPGTTPVPGVSATSNYDLLVANYLDNGPTATLNWTQVGGGPGFDYGLGLALSASSLYVAGSVQLPAAFGQYTIAGPVNSSFGLLGGIAVSGLLAANSPLPTAGPSLYPNPGAAALHGASPGASVGIFDALGRRVATATADATGAAALPAGLAPGLYLVRAGASTVRWAVE